MCPQLRMILRTLVLTHGHERRSLGLGTVEKRERTGIHLYEPYKNEKVTDEVRFDDL